MLPASTTRTILEVPCGIANLTFYNRVATQQDRHSGIRSIGCCCGLLKWTSKRHDPPREDSGDLRCTMGEFHPVWKDGHRPRGKELHPHRQQRERKKSGHFGKQMMPLYGSDGRSLGVCLQLKSIPKCELLFVYCMCCNALCCRCVSSGSL